MIRRSQHRHVWHSFAGAAVLAALLTSVSTLSAQSGYVHLNPVVEALAQGKHVFGVSTSDLSLENAVALAGTHISTTCTSTWNTTLYGSRR